MKSKPVKCEFCEADITSEPCKLASYSTKIDGKEYSFCCKNCAQEHKQEIKKDK